MKTKVHIQYVSKSGSIEFSRLDRQLTKLGIHEILEPRLWITELYLFACSLRVCQRELHVSNIDLFKINLIQFFIGFVWFVIFYFGSAILLLLLMFCLRNCVCHFRSLLRIISAASLMFDFCIRFMANIRIEMPAVQT